MLRLAAAALLAVAAAMGLVTLLGTGGRSAHARHVRRAAPSRRRVTAVRIGASARGRPRRAVPVGSRGRADLLGVGCVHGNEPAGIAVTSLLRRTLASRRIDAWLVDD